MKQEKFRLAVDALRLGINEVQVTMGESLIDVFEMHDYHKFIERLANNERFSIDVTERNFLDFHAPAIMD